MVKLEGACALLISQLKHAAAKQTLGAEEAQLKSRIMQRILVNDAEIRQLLDILLQPRLIGELLGGRDRERALELEQVVEASLGREEEHARRVIGARVIDPDRVHRRGERLAQSGANLRLRLPRGLPRTLGDHIGHATTVSQAVSGDPAPYKVLLMAVTPERRQ